MTHKAAVLGVSGCSLILTGTKPYWTCYIQSASKLSVLTFGATPDAVLSFFQFWDKTQGLGYHREDLYH